MAPPSPDQLDVAASDEEAHRERVALGPDIRRSHRPPMGESDPQAGAARCDGDDVRGDERRSLMIDTRRGSKPALASARVGEIGWTLVDLTVAQSVLSVWPPPNAEHKK